MVPFSRSRNEQSYNYCKIIPITGMLRFQCDYIVLLFIFTTELHFKLYYY